MSEGLLTLALGAGMLAAVNPCGFALLPAYLSLLVVGDEPAPRPLLVGRALRLSAAMSLGFAAVFAVFGLAVAPVAAGVQRHLPWFTVVLGVLLAVLGAALLAGAKLTLPRLGGRRNARPVRASFGSMAGFGAGYAVASLSCTVAPFLAVVVAGFRSESVWVGSALFLAYAAGMGLVVGTVAVAVALARREVVARLRSSGRWAGRIGGALLLAVGGYVAYYGWWELRVLAGGGLDDPVIARAERAQQQLAAWVAAPGPAGWALVGGGLVAATVLLARRGGRTG